MKGFKIRWAPNGKHKMGLLYKSSTSATATGLLCQPSTAPPATIRVYDSMGILAGGVKRQVTTIMRVEVDTITIEVMDVCRQTNGNDCGLYAIANAYQLCNHKDPATCSWEEEMRHHLESCFENLKIEAFPQKPENYSSVGVLLTTTAPSLHCICRKAYKRSEKMAQCTKCKMWFHKKCKDIPLEVFSKSRLVWHCGVC